MSNSSQGSKTKLTGSLWCASGWWLCRITMYRKQDIPDEINNRYPILNHNLKWVKIHFSMTTKVKAKRFNTFLKKKEKGNKDNIWRIMISNIFFYFCLFDWQIEVEFSKDFIRSHITFLYFYANLMFTFEYCYFLLTISELYRSNPQNLLKASLFSDCSF